MRAQGAAVEWDLHEGATGERMGYSIDASSLAGVNPLRCPDCREPALLGKRGCTPHKNVDGDITLWTTECRTTGCGAAFTIFNT